MTKVKVKHATWTARTWWWVDTDVKLPQSPITSGGAILAPERFLKDILRVTSEGLAWAETNAAKELRDDLNYDLSKDLSLTQKRAAARNVARRRPKLVVRYIRKIEESILLPYDVEADPRGLVRWREAGEAAAVGLMKPEDAPEKAEDFTAFVERLATDFQHQVENTDLWTALWYKDKTRHVQEAQVQAIAGAMWTIECKNGDVDLSQEVNRGRGPVDFKFSKGWKKRALLEVKFIENTKFFNGAKNQLPQYLRTEQIAFGVFLCVGFTDADFQPARQKRVDDAIKAIKDEMGVTIKAVYVDARKTNKTSVSKLEQGGHEHVRGFLQGRSELRDAPDRDRSGRLHDARALHRLLASKIRAVRARHRAPHRC